MQAFNLIARKNYESASGAGSPGKLPARSLAKIALPVSSAKPGRSGPYTWVTSFLHFIIWIFQTIDVFNFSKRSDESMLFE
jgi:hypothetical protein